MGAIPGVYEVNARFEVEAWSKEQAEGIICDIVADVDNGVLLVGNDDVVLMWVRVKRTKRAPC